MNTFRSIDELVKMFEREKVLLKEMFYKRKQLSFRYDYALELTEYKEERIRFLIEYGVLRESGDFLEMEDLYLKFFEEVLQINEEINVSFVQDYLNHLNDNIDYFLKENNEQRKYAYQREVRRCLKNIALATVRNVMDLKRNLDVTYKTEPNYQVKLAKLKKLDEKRRNIALFITRSEEVIDSQQPTFFRVAMDVQMRAVVSDVKLQLNDSYHNLIEIEKQIIHYLNLIAYQNRIFEKVRRLKYLRDQFLLEENTDKLSLSNLHTSEVALELIRKVMSRRKKDSRGPRNVAGAIPESYLSQAGEVMDRVNLQEVFNAFAASGTHLFRFVMNYSYGKPVAEEDKLLFFCQLASQYADELDFTDHYESTSEVEYPLIYLRQNP